MIQFRVTHASAATRVATPTIVFGVQLETREPLRSVLLQTDVRIEAARRAYSDEEVARLVDLFGERERHRTTLRSLEWTRLSQMVPAFDRKHELEVLAPCSNDLDLAATKYVHALREGTVPVTLQFRGTVFRAANNGVDVVPLPWSCDASFSLPLEVFREAVEAAYPNQAFVRVSRKTVDRLLALKAQRCVADFDTLLAELAREASS